MEAVDIEKKLHTCSEPAGYAAQRGRRGRWSGEGRTAHLSREMNNIERKTTLKGEKDLTSGEQNVSPGGVQSESGKPGKKKEAKLRGHM